MNELLFMQLWARLDSSPFLFLSLLPASSAPPSPSPLLRNSSDAHWRPTVSPDVMCGTSLGYWKLWGWNLPGESNATSGIKINLTRVWGPSNGPSKSQTALWLQLTWLSPLMLLISLHHCFNTDWHFLTSRKLKCIMCRVHFWMWVKKKAQ